MLWVLKEIKIADMDLYPYRLFSIAPPLAVVSKCALAGESFLNDKRTMFNDVCRAGSKAA